MKTIVFFIAIIMLFAYSAKTSISFSPFKITMGKPAEFFGLVFLALGLGFLRYQAEKDGFQKGVDKSIEAVKEGFENYKK